MLLTRAKVLQIDAKHTHTCLEEVLGSEDLFERD